MSHNQTEADVAFIRALAELLNEHKLTELEVDREYGDDDRLSVRVCRSPAPVAAAHAPALAGAPVTVSVPAAPGPGPGPAAAPEDDPAALPGIVTSPMVGTVYLSPEPGADAFVRLGEAVAEGQTLLIIEAMKTMNQIPAPRAGVVKRILIADGVPVEYGAPLLVIE